MTLLIKNQTEQEPLVRGTMIELLKYGHLLFAGSVHFFTSLLSYFIGNHVVFSSKMFKPHEMLRESLRDLPNRNEHSLEVVLVDYMRCVTTFIKERMESHDQDEVLGKIFRVLALEVINRLPPHQLSEIFEAWGKMKKVKEKELVAL